MTAQAHSPYTNALKLFHTVAEDDWRLAYALVDMVDNQGGTLRDFAKAAEGHADGEQKFSNRYAAAKFMLATRHDYEDVMGRLWKAGLKSFSYYSAVWRHHETNGAMLDECIDLLEQCFDEFGKQKGTRWLDREIDKTVGKGLSPVQRLKKLNTAIFDFLYGGAYDDNWPSGLVALLRSIEGMLKPLIGKVAK